MKLKQASTVLRDPGKHPAFWRGSIYEEPLWVSLAWLIGPIIVAALAIYFVVN